MSLIRSLRIQLNEIDVGSLFEVDDGRVYFRFDDEYCDAPGRPVLSQSYKAANEIQTQKQLRDVALKENRGNGSWGLPPFFQNLLPEGQLRKHLMELGNFVPHDEFGLLGFCGLSLPGGVTALSEKHDEEALGRLIAQGKDSYEMSSAQMPTPEGVSLSGVQPKIELVQASGGRYVMRSKDGAGAHFIGKLPASDYPLMPEVEYSSMKLAEAAGVNICQFELLPLSDIKDNLPFGLREDAENFLLVHRFDRDAATPTHRLHMEDFAQATATPSGNKYSGTYAAMGRLLATRSMYGADDALELLRRIKVNELLGNFDAHLKNFSLLYTPETHQFYLSPAYDIVAYAAYTTGTGHALAILPDQKPRQLLTPAAVRGLANIWEIPEPKLTKVLVDTVDKAMTLWPELLPDLPLTPSHQARIESHMDANPSVQAWKARRARQLASSENSLSRPSRPRSGF